MTADVSEATVVTLYLLSSSNAKLRPMLTQTAPPRLADRLARVLDGTRRGRPTRSIGSRRRPGDEITLYLWKTDGKVRP